MTLFNVHLYREMRLTFSGVQADSPLEAATIAGAKPSGDADHVDDCEGENLAALVDAQIDVEYSESVTIDFEAERTRGAASRLLASLEALLPYAQNEADALDRLKDGAEAADEALRARQAIEAARADICRARAAGVSPSPQDVDIRALLAGQKQIAEIWGVFDVQEVRPQLTDEQAWAVLQSVHRHHDAEIGVNWDVLACHADELFPTTDLEIE